MKDLNTLLPCGSIVFVKGFNKPLVIYDICKDGFDYTACIQGSLPLNGYFQFNNEDIKSVQYFNS